MHAKLFDARPSESTGSVFSNPDPKDCQSPGYPASNRWSRRAQTQIGYYIFSITPTWASKILAKN